MPDLVGDPRLANVNQPAGPNPLHDDDPSNDDQFEAWKANADLWREWAAKQDEAIANLVQQGASQGQTAEQTLQKAGFKNAKEQGMHAFTMYGTGGYYSQMGAAADPGWRYDWNTGLKYNMGTDDLSARTRGVPINANEYAERQKAQNYAKAGINDYGMQANATAFQKAVSYGHFTKDPKSGNYYNIGQGDPNNPATWQWSDQYGRALKGGAQGVPTGQSFTGQPLSSGAFGGGGFGNGYTPGGEASAFSAANLNDALAESTRNDILGQQMQLQKGLEGHAIGSSIYDYMLNDVYGKVLGVNFQGNPQGVAQYSQGLQRGTPNTYQTYQQPSSANYPGFQGPTDNLYWASAPGDVPRDPQGNPLPGANPGDTWGEQGPDQNPDDFYGPANSPVRVPGTGKPKTDGTTNEVIAASNFAGGGGAPNPGEEILSMGGKAPVGYTDYQSQITAESGGLGAGSGGPAPMDDNKYQTLGAGAGGPPRSQGGFLSPGDEKVATAADLKGYGISDSQAQSYLANGFTIGDLKAYGVVSGGGGASLGGGAGAASTIGKGTNTQPGQTGAGGISVGIANAVQQAAQNPATAQQYLNAIAQGLPEADKPKAKAFLDAMLAQGIINQQQYQHAMAGPAWTGSTQTTQGQQVNALGTPLPIGSHTQTGVTALNPNMNSSWASFLAPTFNEQMKSRDQEMAAIKAALPRGGAQDRAVSSSIRDRYGSLQSAWQGLVPTALQGVSDIGKEMYFQQPAANSGAMGTAAGVQAANQQYNLGQQQLKSQEKVASQQANAAKWGAIGGGLTSLLAAPFTGGTSLLGGLLGGGAKSVNRPVGT